MAKTIVFTGGGTGGHVFPGLAVAEALQEKLDQSGLGGRKGYRIVWIGSRKGLEKSIVRRWGIPFYSVPAGKLRRYFTLRTLLDAFLVLAGFIGSFLLFLRLRPVIVFSKGGYVSVPPSVTARLFSIPVFTHESDVDPGLANRMNARVAEKIFVAYEITRKHFPGMYSKRVFVTGNPVRKEIYQGSRERGRAMIGVPDGVLVLLVLGGSQGALQINTILRDSFEALSKNYFVVHQSGIHDEDSFKHMESSGRYFRRETFVEEFPDLLAAADVVLSRAGAGALWEFAALGKPSILVPLCGAGTRGDQILNAQMFAGAGAAVSFEGEAATPERIVLEAEKFIKNPERLAEMGGAARKMGEMNASQTIADLILERIRFRGTGKKQLKDKKGDKS